MCLTAACSCRKLLGHDTMSTHRRKSKAMLTLQSYDSFDHPTWVAMWSVTLGVLVRRLHGMLRSSGRMASFTGARSAMGYAGVISSRQCIASIATIISSENIAPSADPAQHSLGSAPQVRTLGSSGKRQSSAVDLSARSVSRLARSMLFCGYETL